MSNKSTLNPRRTPRARDSHPGQMLATARKKANQRKREPLTAAERRVQFEEVCAIRQRATDAIREAIARSLRRAAEDAADRGRYRARS